MKIPLVILVLIITISNTFASGDIKILARNINKYNYEKTPVLIEVKLINTKKTAEVVDLGWDRKGNIQIVSEGTTYTYHPLSEGGLKFSGKMEISAGDSQRTVIILNDWISIEKGDHKIRVAVTDRTDLISSEASFSVQTATPSDLSSLIKNLIDLAQSEENLTIKNEYLDTLSRMYEFSAFAKQIVTEIFRNAEFSKLAEELKHYMKLKESQKGAID